MAEDENKFLELQFNTLRKEIEDAKGRAFKILAGEAFAIPIVQFLIGIKASDESANILTIILPFLILILVLRFVYENNSVIRCGRYIRFFIEPYYIKKYSQDLNDCEINRGKYKGWESWLERTNNREAEKIMKRSFYLLSAIYYIFSVIFAEIALETNYNTVKWHWIVVQNVSDIFLAIYGLFGVVILYIIFNFVLTSTDNRYEGLLDRLKRKSNSLFESIKNLRLRK